MRLWHLLVKAVVLALALCLVAPLMAAVPAGATSNLSGDDDQRDNGPVLIEYDNDEVLDWQTGLVTAHNVGMVAGFSWEPISSYAGETTAYSTNLALKQLPPILEVPDGVTVRPDRDGGQNDCVYEYTLPQRVDSYTNLFGLVDVDPIETDWGLLSSGGSGPRVQHANSDVSLTVRGSGLPDPDDPASSGPASDPEKPIDVELDEGSHSYIWEADTQISEVFDVAIPLAFMAFNAFVETRYGKVIGKYLAKKGISKQVHKNALQVAYNIALEAGVVSADVAIDSGRDVGEPWARQARRQSVVVQDIHTPTIGFDPTKAGEPNRPDRATVEAVDYGGIAFDRIQTNLRDRILVDDPCGEATKLAHDWSGELVPISEQDHAITWTVSDNPESLYASGVAPTASVTQYVRVEDTQAPILVAPPSRVIESASAVPSGEPVLGTPLVADLADPAPTVTVDNRRDFPVDTRTLVQWSATDASGNRSTADQTVTVKRPGTNTAPTANPARARTLTSQPVDIVLRAKDNDVIGGVADPLTMRIERRPENGEFVAPLYPYFIEDYRMSPVGPFGDWADDGRYRRFQDFLKGEFCDQSPRQPIPVDWVYGPSFFQVRDDGTTFIRDRYWACDQIQANTPKTWSRISVWDRDRNFIGQTTNIQDDSRVPSFEIDDRYLYTVSWQNRGSATNRMVVQRTPQDVTADGTADNWEICNCPGTQIPDSDPVSFSTLVNGRPDDTGDLLYVTDERSVSVWDARPQSLVNGNKPKYLANLAGDRFNPILGANGTGGSRGHNVALDTDGNVYVAGSGRNRVHKFTRSYFADDGTFVQGEYVGWMGKCTSGQERRCDEDAEVSRGFSCTDATCSVTGDTAGSEQGQFDDPSYVAIDPNGVIYVADYGNQRIQRFGSDGTFAGLAQSTGDGVTSDGSFVLGNFGQPRHVTVNSDQFFILEGQGNDSFLHVFESSPIIPESVTADSAMVTYVSDFVSGPSDSFTFVASDGLVDSAPATVSIDIDRADRAPIQVETELSATATEDQSVAIDVRADDPDGIDGRDFRGLDTVSFQPADPPGNGSVTVNSGTCGGGGDATHAGCITYRPNPDFNGTDRFTITAVDSRGLTSEPATVTVEVSPVSDVPAVSMEPVTAFRGFPTAVAFNYDDPDRSEDESFRFSYAFDAAGDQADRLGPLTPDDRFSHQLFDGSTLTDAVNARRGPGHGTVIVPHTFDEARSYLVSGCAADGADRDFVCSDQVAVDVVEAADVAVYLFDPADPRSRPDTAPPGDEFEPYLPSVAPGQNLDLVLRVENRKPDSYRGLEANRIAVELTNGLGVELSSAAGCTTGAGGGVRCEVDALQPGESRDIGVTVSAAAEGFAAVQSLVSADVEYRDAGATRNRRTNLVVAVDWTDTDGDQMPDAYETANGLDPTVDDAQGDIDGDGVSNIDEYYEALGNDGQPIERDILPVLDGGSPVDGDGDGTGSGDGETAVAQADGGGDGLAMRLFGIALAVLVSLVIVGWIAVIVARVRRRSWLGH